MYVCMRVYKLYLYFLRRETNFKGILCIFDYKLRHVMELNIY